MYEQYFSHLARLASAVRLEGQGVAAGEAPSHRARVEEASPDRGVVRREDILLVLRFRHRLKS